MYMCIYIYIYVYIYMCIYIYIYKYIYIHIGEMDAVMSCERQTHTDRAPIDHSSTGGKEPGNVGGVGSRESEIIAPHCIGNGTRFYGDFVASHSKRSTAASGNMSSNSSSSSSTGAATLYLCSYLYVCSCLCLYLYLDLCTCIHVYMYTCIHA